MLINLPGEIELSCPSCRRQFVVATSKLHDRRELNCPFCADKFEVYDALPSMLRCRVYQTIRDEVEHRVYNEQRKQGGNFIDEWGPPAEPPTNND